MATLTWENERYFEKIEIASQKQKDKDMNLTLRIPYFARPRKINCPGEGK
jgi:hypothetical protein